MRALKGSHLSKATQAESGHADPEARHASPGLLTTYKHMCSHMTPW